MADIEIPVNLYDELPEWSNAENREKHAEILKMHSDLQNVTDECKELQERVQVLSEHLKNVHSEVNTTQQLLTAKNAQVEQEKHLQQLISRERGKLQSEMRRIEEKTTDVQAKWSEVQAKTFKSQQRIEAFKEEAKMNQQQLEQWILIARQKEEDYLVIQRYQREDEGKIKSMLLEIEKSAGVVEAKRAELQQEITSTRALQIELDMTAAQFRKMHEERTQLLQQWENTMKQMQQLNSQIEKSTSYFDSRKLEVDKLHSHVQEEKKNLDAAETENKSIERQLTISDHKVSQLHRQLEDDTHNLAEFNETIETQRHNLEKLEGDQRHHNEEIQRFRDMIAQEVQKKENFAKRLQDTEMALLAQKDLTLDINEQTNIMNNFLKTEEKKLKSLEQEIDVGKQSIFKLSQEVQSVKKKEADLRAEIQGSKARAKNLQMKIQAFDKETQKQMELLYNSDFQIQQMERKISRISGGGTDDEKTEFQAQIDQLNSVLENKLEVEKLLGAQLRRLDLDLRSATRKKEALGKNRIDLEEKLNEVKLDQDSLDKSMIKARTDKESVLVQLNMLRLQVEKLTEQVNMKAGELISLENRRQQLQLSMAERVLEIDTHIAALRTQLKTEEEARHLATIELSERAKRASTLESKYEIMMSRYQSDGNEISQSERVIKLAEEKEEVTRRGDELEEQVKTAIQELKALEKAMGKMDNQNAQFRSAYGAVSENDNEMERRKVLEEQVKVAQQRLNARKAEANSNAQERASKEATYSAHEKDIEQIQHEINKLRPSLDKMSADNNDLKEKINRASKILSKAKEKHRSENSISSESKYPSTLLEMDVELRILKSAVENASQELARIAEANSETKPKISLAFTQMGIPLKSSNTPSIYPKGPHIVEPRTSGSASKGSLSGSRNNSIHGSGRSSAVNSHRSANSNTSNNSKASNKSIASIKNITLD